LYDGGYKVVGSLLLVIGWIVTSDKAREVLRGSAAARFAGATGVLCSAVGSAYLTLQLQQKSAHTAEMLDRLNYVPREFYADRIVTAGTAWVVIVIGSVIACAAVVLMFRLRDDRNLLTQPHARGDRKRERAGHADA